jgi:hypothetical protein
LPLAIFASPVGALETTTAGKTGSGAEELDEDEDEHGEKIELEAEKRHFHGSSHLDAGHTQSL